MIHTLRDAFWFARHSWPYLGCDKGNGRWRARRRYERFEAILDRVRNT